MFALHRMNNGAVCAPTIKQIPANTGVQYKIGDAIAIISGKASKATGTTKPEYICAEEATGKDVISAYTVDNATEYKTTKAGDGALTVGAKYTINTDAAQITTTATNGVAEVVEVLDDGVIVKF